MNQYIQIILAILVVIILFVIAMMVYDKDRLDAIRSSGQLRKVVPIFSGVVDFANIKDVAFNTVDPSMSNYVNLSPSINQAEGASYSYNFWLYLDNTAATDAGNATLFSNSTQNTNTNAIYADSGLTAPIALNRPQATNGDDLPYVLFLRGSNTVVEYKNICSPKTASADLSSTANVGTYKQDVLIKSPLVKLEHNGEALTVEFNTISSPDGVKAGSPNTCQVGGNPNSSDWTSVNQFKIGLLNINNNPAITGKWFMVTIVLEDTLPTDPLPLRNKIRCRIYLNGVIELDKYVIGKLSDPANKSASPLRINQGNIYLNPTLYSNVGYNPFKTSGAAVAGSKVGTTPQPVTTPSPVTQTKPIGKNKFLMADLQYFNYPLQVSDAVGLFNNKFNTNIAVLASQTQQTGLQLTTQQISTNSTTNVNLIAPNQFVS
jgi:hypothetical protein